MKAAVTYDNGTIFQHFGRTENFKVVEIEDGKVVFSEMIGSNGSGHEALAGILAQNGVDVLICGGIGGGAQAALAEAGIQVISGAEGDVDAAIEAFINGELQSAGTNCHHHEEEEHHCCGGDEEGCGGGCGGCGGGCGGCHEEVDPIVGKNVKMTCRVHYTGTFNDGTKFDSSLDRGEPLEFVCGAGMMIRGFDQAVANMEVGEQIDIHLMPEEAYGLSNPNMILNFKISELPGSENLELGQRVYMRNAYGQRFPVTVTAKDEENITLDANHEMAGKELNFHIELLEVL